MPRDLKVEMEHSEWFEGGVPRRRHHEWFLRIRWENGRKAFASENYVRKATARRLGKKIAKRLGCPFVEV